MTPPSQAAASGAARAPRPMRVVLDTNAVLDWLWFADARATGFAAALHSGALCWLATAPMRAELDCVLGRLARHRSSPTREHVLTSFDRWAAPSDIAPTAHRLRCTDPDDQKFIDLAVTAGAGWLLSRDRAVLKLARRAAPFGLTIAVPERWAGGPGLTAAGSVCGT